MKSLCKILTIAGFMAVSVSTMAADWTIMQSATITTATPQITQGNATLVTTSTQAINGIALESTADDVAAGSSQLATLTASSSFTLTQGPLVSGAKQAINHIEAQNVGATTVGQLQVGQTVTVTSPATTLVQIVGAGGGASNLQAMNAVEASKVVGGIIQTMGESGSLTLTQDSVTTANNTQAVNYTEGATVGETLGSVTQNWTANGATAFSQGATGGTNVQGGNIARSTGTGGIHASQGFTGTALDLNQFMATAGDSNTQAVNYADSTANSSADIVSLTQDLTVTGVTKFLSNAGLGSASNIQAGNLARSANNIDSAAQTFTASNASALTFEQTVAGSNNTQAGNMATIEAGDIAEITQTFTGSTTANTFTQTAPTGANSTQAANLIDLGTGGLSDSSGAQQVYSPGGPVAMEQFSGTSHLQALNATVDKTRGTAAVNIHQSVTASKALTMTQTNVTNSGQFANFAGLAY